MRYVRAVFVSDNVMIHLKGSPSVITNEGISFLNLPSIFSAWLGIHRFHSSKWVFCNQVQLRQACRDKKLRTIQSFGSVSPNCRGQQLVMLWGPFQWRCSRPSVHKLHPFPQVSTFSSKRFPLLLEEVGDADMVMQK